MTQGATSMPVQLWQELLFFHLSTIPIKSAPKVAAPTLSYATEFRFQLIMLGLCSFLYFNINVEVSMVHAVFQMTWNPTNFLASIFYSNEFLRMGHVKKHYLSICEFDTSQSNWFSLAIVLHNENGTPT